MTELYERQAALDLITPSVAIVGCGGVGVWAALAICMGGAERVDLFDSDEVAMNNLNRLPFSQESIGQPKSYMLARLLSQLRPDCEINARANFNPELHTFEHYNWVVCCTDSLKSRLMIRAAAAEVNAAYIELGADGERWTLGAEPPQFHSELELNPGYSSVPVHVGPCMMAGAAAAYYVLHNCIPPADHVGEWRDDSLVLQEYRDTPSEAELLQLNADRLMADLAAGELPLVPELVGNNPDYEPPELLYEPPEVELQAEVDNLVNRVQNRVDDILNEEARDE